MKGFLNGKGNVKAAGFSNNNGNILFLCQDTAVKKTCLVKKDIKLSQGQSNNYPRPAHTKMYAFAIYSVAMGYRKDRVL